MDKQLNQRKRQPNRPHRHHRIHADEYDAGSRARAQAIQQPRQKRRGHKFQLLPVGEQARGKQQQASAYEKTAKEHIAAAILEARVYVSGEICTVKAATVKDKLESALSALVESVYSKLGYIRRYFDNDTELLQVLTSPHRQTTLDGGVALDNPEAVEEVEQYLTMQSVKLLPTSMGDIQRRFSAIPYGWREIDIAGVICTLIAEQKVVLQYSGSTIQPTGKHIPDHLRRKTEIDKTLVARRTAISDSLMKRSREFLKEYFNTMDLPSDEDGLIAYVLDGFSGERERLQGLLDSAYAAGGYPDKSAVENGIKLCTELLSQRKDNTALLNKLVSMSEDLLDLSEDLAEVDAFFKNQRPIFDSAAALLTALSGESEYLQAEPETTQALAQIQAILRMPKPYPRIAALPELMRQVQTAYGQLMELKRQEVYSDIQAAMGEIHQTATPAQRDTVVSADTALGAKKQAAAAAETLTQLDAMRIQIGNIRQQYIKRLIAETTPPAEDTVTANRSSLCYSAKLKSEADVDAYVAQVRERLLQLMDGHDVLHII